MGRTQEQIQDEWLVLRCQEADENALKALVMRWQPRFLLLASRLIGRREPAGDVVQEAWLAIIKGLSRLDDPARFASWAYRIVSNKCTDWIRRQSAGRSVRRSLLEEAENRAAPQKAGADGEAAASDVRTAVTQLDGPDQALLSLYYVHDLSVAVIAEVLEISAGTVKSRLFHARSRLKEAIERSKR